MVTLLPPEKRKETQRATRVTHIVSRGFVLLLFGYLLVALGLGGFFMYTFVIKQQVVDRHGKLEGEVKAMRDREASLVVLKDRASTLATAARDPTNFRRALELAIDLVGNDEKLTIRDIVNDRKTIELTVSGSDTFALEDLFESIKEKEGLSQVTLESLTRFRDGEYIASLKIQL